MIYCVRTTYELKLIEGQQLPAAGFYTIVVAATPKGAQAADKRFFLVAKSVEVKVTTQASIADFQIGVADRDQTAPKLTRYDDSFPHIFRDQLFIILEKNKVSKRTRAWAHDSRPTSSRNCT